MMNFAIVSTAVLAAAAVVTLPYQKPNGRNELTYREDGYGDRHDYHETFPVPEERDSLADSFDAVVNIARRYSAERTADDGPDEIGVPDAVDAGDGADTFFSDVTVKGLKYADARNVTVSFGDGLVYTEIGWQKLTVNGAFRHVNPAARHGGAFEVVLVRPKYAGNTSLTRNAYVHPAAGSVTFETAVVRRAELPEVFQDDAPRFDHLLKNVVCRYVAEAAAARAYDDATADFRRSVSPYVTYRSDGIGDDAAAVAGRLDGGVRYEFKNARVHAAATGPARIAFVRTTTAGAKNAAAMQLLVFGLSGQSDWTAAAADGAGGDYGGTVAFRFDRVLVAPAIDLDDKTVRTAVLVERPRAEYKPLRGDDAPAFWTDAVRAQLTDQLVEHFVQKLAEATSRSIQNSIG